MPPSGVTQRRLSCAISLQHNEVQGVTAVGSADHVQPSKVFVHFLPIQSKLQSVPNFYYS